MLRRIRDGFGFLVWVLFVVVLAIPLMLVIAVIDWLLDSLFGKVESRCSGCVNAVECSGECVY